MRVGDAGESWTVRELERYGWDARRTPANAQQTDVIATHVRTRRRIELQCKTSGEHQENRFRLNKACESPSTPDRGEWFVFVKLRGGGSDQTSTSCRAM